MKKVGPQRYQLTGYEHDLMWRMESVKIPETKCTEQVIMFNSVRGLTPLATWRERAQCDSST